MIDLYTVKLKPVSQIEYKSEYINLTRLVIKLTNH